MATLDDYKEVLEQFLPPGVPWGTSVRYSRLLSAGRFPATYGLVATSGALEELAHYNPQEGIVLRRNEVGTAAGLSLLVHEATHALMAQQHKGGPRQFVIDYERAEKARLAEGLPVWANFFEYPAYLAECRAFKILVAEGWEPGPWTPLGVTEGLCGATSA